MIRLTTLLVTAIGLTMVIAGREPEGPQGSDQPAGEVARIQSDMNSGGLMAAQAAEPKRLPLDAEAKAIEAAIKATQADPEPNAEPKLIKASAPATEAAVASDRQAREMWVVTGSVVNLRSGPSTANEVVGQVSRGEKAEVLEETTDGWFRIRTESTTAYIYGQFLEPQRG
ncbi:SH3 domain-containing protein [Tranquillimonas rosea]|uniref:SH3 domain-containing protein n=1 Tax=Tranquillimonas rosea TaxID=641238 RepID=A0A1H9U3E8_9RHOB|nr:SH3 domain-containing protein [Tranquillimonas rosea]SES03899.1 SH3 domain-containing protein [Tranquillimonas rosea]